MSEELIMFETVRAGEWLRARFPSVLAAANRVLFRACWNEAKSDVERWREALAARLADAGFLDAFPVKETMIATPSSEQGLQAAIFNRCALAEQHPFWPRLDVTARVALASRLGLVTAVRFVVLKTRIYRREAVPADAPFEYRAPDGTLHHLRVDLISPVPGYAAPR